METVVRFFRISRRCSVEMQNFGASVEMERFRRKFKPVRALAWVIMVIRIRFTQDLTKIINTHVSNLKLLHAKGKDTIKSHQAPPLSSC